MTIQEIPGTRFFDHPPIEAEREACIRSGVMPGHTMPCTECHRAVAPAACIFCSGTKIARNLDTSVIYDLRWCVQAP